MRLSKQFQDCLFFLAKRFRAHKITPHLEVYVRVKSYCLCCLVLVYFCFVSWFLLVAGFCGRKIFLSKKKKNRLEIVLITSIYYTTEENSDGDVLVYLAGPMHKRYSSTFVWAIPFSTYVCYDRFFSSLPPWTHMYAFGVNSILRTWFHRFNFVLSHFDFPCFP